MRNVDDQPTSFGQRIFRPKRTTSEPLRLRGSTTASVFAPMRLERRLLLVLTPLIAVTFLVVWISSVITGHATWVDQYQLLPLAALSLGLFIWTLRSRPTHIWKPRAALLLLGCGFVFQRFTVGLWYTAADGYDPSVMRDMLPWMIVGSMLCILLVPGHRGTISALVNYGANGVAVIVFLVAAPDALHPALASDLILTVLVAHLLVIVGMVVFARVRVAYGKAMARSEDLEVMAMEDALTGILNRRAFSFAFKRARARSFRKHTPVSLMLIDIDHFKAVNDELGHTVGDHTLRALAGLLVSESRTTDEVFRCGGEEFLILLEDTDSQAANEVAERVRERVRSTSLLHDRTMTVSIGVAELAEEESEVELFTRADVALYKAKNAGRDRVALAPAPEADTWENVK